MNNEKLAMRNEGRERVIRANKSLLVMFLLLGVICFNAVAQDVAVFPQLGHTFGVSSVAFSPDGKHILSGSYDGTIKLWDINTGREIRTFSSHTDAVASVAFSPDGRQILSGSFDQTIKLWDVNTGKEIRTFSGHTGQIYSVSFSPDGRQILSSCGGNKTNLWLVNTGKLIRTFSGHMAIFNPNSRQILSIFPSNTMKLLDIDTGMEIRTFSGHTYAFISVAFSPDGKQILSGSEDDTIKLWDANSGREIRTFSGHTGSVLSVAFSPDGKQILSGSYDGTIKLWDTNTGKEIKTFSGHFRSVMSVTFSFDGKQILSGSYDGTIKLWDTNTRKEIKTFSGHTNRVMSTDFNSDGNQLIFGFNHGSIKLWDINTGKEIRTLSWYSDTNSISFSPGGKHILSFFSDGTIKLLDANTGKEISTFLGVDGFVNSITFSPNNKQFLSSFNTEEGGIIKIWDFATGREINTISLSGCDFNHATFDSNGKNIIAEVWGRRGGGGGSLSLFDSVTGHVIIDIVADYVYSSAVSPDRKQVLYGNLEGEIFLCDVNSGKKIMEFSGHTDEVRSVTFSPDGKQVISASRDGTIKLWNTNTGKVINTFSGNTFNVKSMSFKPDGRQILSISDDGTVRLWDVSTGKEIAQFISFIDGEWLVITPDGYYKSSPNGDKYLNVRVGNNVYGIDQYKKTFYNPQIVEARLQGKPDPVRVDTNIDDAASFSPPEVVISNPQDGATLTSNQVELSVTVIDQKQPIKTIMVLVNGKLIGGNQARGISSTRGVELEIDTTQIRIKGNQNRVEFKLPITLDSGVNKIEVKATNSYSEGRRIIEVTNKQAVSQNTRPNLYILAIGVNRYDDTQRLPTLKYAVNDAKAIIDALKAQAGKRYGKVEALLIADGEKITPTRDNIIDNFSHLRKAGPNDVILLFIAGHGINDQDNEFYFMPSDAAFNDNGSIRPSKAISFREIQKVLVMPGQKLVFIDACHSAGTSGGLARRVNNDRLINDLNSDASIRSSSVIFTSSKGDQSSLEMEKYRHGVFTYAILQGLKGEADFLKKGVITTTALDLYLRDKVRELTQNQQEPKSFRADGLDDFEIVILK